MEDLQFSLDYSLGQRLPLKMLIVDDNLINLKLAESMLNLLGYKVDTAVSGIECLDILDREKYDLILMDVQMPEMDGIETTQKIFEKFALEIKPVIIAITANTLPGDREKCLAAGMTDYLAKPLKFQELQKVIEKWGSQRYQ